ncbi:primary-amine oxidase [Nonomuraea soli]|uniref:Amine oxidase n=1 Tax=Nonomuraea soli TaxID=1032476 RepID=A0A7W0CMI7_9ACTN|nr:primary-amine oxidase [Nonomuraea soli]MBA2893720.1 primary-amine oxidase [Nonomuraea soli]
MTHPLDRLTADEFTAALELLTREGLVGETTRLPYLGLEEPAKEQVLGHKDGDPVDRRVRAVLLDLDTGRARTVLASLTRSAVDHVADIAAGQPPVLLEEYPLVEEIVKADPRFEQAMAARGITDLDLVRVAPLSAGDYGIEGERGRRMLRSLMFLQHRPDDHAWAHPIDGIVAYVDLIGRRVAEFHDHQVFPVPVEEGNYDRPTHTRDTLKPIEITQPDGPSFAVEGDVVSWENWRLRIGFDAREGLILHQLSFHERPIVYRASIAEMVVPYGDPSPTRFWQNYFDAGEYLLGAAVNSLRLGCDCLGEIRYFDAVLPEGDGTPRVVENAICLHEEDHGILWKHTDLYTEAAETRRQRRLVISFFVTVGNYDYGFYWYLYLDGTIQLEVKATGVLFTAAHVEDSPYATPIAPGLAAPYHQHLYCARLDMMLDGTANTVVEQEVERLPIGPANPYGNAFTRRLTPLRTESQAQRDADPLRDRVWRITNPGSLNRLGQPVSYVLHPQGRPVLLASDESSISGRAAFATHHLWVTRYHPDERYPAGEFVNQSSPGEGLPSYAAADRPLEGEDLVVWHTFGSTHLPRPEDWPIMPVDTCGFTLKPSGFFDRNPTLDVPASAARHCH